MANRIILILCLIFCAMEAFSKSELPAKPQLMEVGQFHGDEIQAKTGEEWLGLYANEGHPELRLTTITVNIVNDPIVDRENEQTGKEVSVNQGETPIFLVKGLSELKPGAVATSFMGSQNLLDQMSIDLKLGEKNYRLVLETQNIKDGMLTEDAQVVLICEGERQVLRSMKVPKDPVEVGWYLNWAGDLDADGKLDLYMQLSNHYNVSEKRLYLSSRAGKGRLLRQAASFTTVGC